MHPSANIDKHFINAGNMLIKYIAVKYVGGFQTQLKIFFFEVAKKKSVGSYACILPLHYGDIIWGDKSNETLMS